LQKEHYDFFVFGHRHLPIDYSLNGSSRYINLGDWLSFYTYAVFDGQDVEVKSYLGKEDKIYKKA
jgi:UDP-2,3-diacylglucosamine hydrolase